MGFLGNVSSSVKVKRKSGEGEYFGEGMPEVGNRVEAPSIVEMAALGAWGRGHLREEPSTFCFFRVGKY